jgi:DNA-binding transcriptional MerR regulator
VNPEPFEFGSGDVCQLAGVSLRQVQWWDERSIISPRQQEHRRLYRASDVLGMMIIAELRRKGLSLQKIRQLVRPVRREMERKLDELLSGKSELYLLTDGKTSHFEEQCPRIIEMLGKSRKPMALIAVSDLAKRLAEFQQTVRTSKSYDRSGTSSGCSDPTFTAQMVAGHDVHGTWQDR